MRKLALVLPTLLIILPLVPHVLSSVDVSSINRFTNRKAMFLFFNAILLFIARDSGLLLPPSVANLLDEHAAVKGSETRPRNDVVQVEGTSIAVTSDKLASEQSVSPGVVAEEKHAEPLELVVAEEGSDEVEIAGDAVVMENPGPGCMNSVDDVEWIEEDSEVDEFNRRCEEFIEKIKRERRKEIW